ncbi:abscisic acid receptor PYL4-like [Lycium barbarum]|uniref:abscisic acid receptor PYL4-like n=1 Tax=Lycium barbarum TaxID=112863 RepID=UPI00293E6F37|nr:abscisic acid receptor PYL4-like [Lycium barbarum]
MTSTLQLHHINHHNTTTTLSKNFHKQQQQHPTWPIPDNLFHYHNHAVGPTNNNQCCSTIVQSISASIDTIWSIISRFDTPQTYKHFLKSCHVILGDGKKTGSLREVHVISGLPAASSIERLEILDDEKHVMSISIIGGEHRLSNYRSVTTLHRTVEEDGGDGEGTEVVESYVVDVPHGNTKEETCVFVDTIVRCNLQSLAQLAENLEKTKYTTTMRYLCN